MKRLLRLIVAATLGVSLARAQNLVFNDGFTTDALSWTNPAYPTVTTTSTGWAVLTNKSSPAPTLSGGVLTINMAATSSGFAEAQALFSPQPIQLLNGTYIEVVMTFVSTYILTNASDNLIVGLYNSGGVGPLYGLLSSGLSNTATTFATGGAKGWIGYNGNIPQAGSPKLQNRVAQTATNNTVQDVVVDSQSTSVGYSTPAAVAASGVGSFATTLTNGNTYTLDYKLALNSAGTTLTATVSLYNGTGVTGTGANTRIGTYSGTFSGSALLTKSFDALALGWRADAAGQSSNLKISSLKVYTTGGAPWLTTSAPGSIAVAIGDTLNLNTVVAGAPTAYQWQFSSNGGSSYTNIDATANPSAATASLTLANIQNSDAGMYRLVVTNAAGSATSSTTTVTVSATPVAPTISVDPVSTTVLGGTSYTFSAVVNGTSPLNYQWQKSTDNVAFTDIGGATSATYTIASVSLADEGYYRVAVSNVAGAVSSGSCFLTVNQPLVINTQPVGGAVNPGDSFTLSVGAAGRPAPTYQWSRNGAAITGATNASYTIASAAAADAGLYTVTVSNSAGDQVVSAGAAVAVVSSGFTVSSRGPANGAGGVISDRPLTLTFSGPVSVGLTGQIRIYDATNPTSPVDTIDLVAGTALMKTMRQGSTLSTQALPVQSKTIGGVTNFNYYPITVSGNTATIYPRNGAIRDNKSYYVIVEPGVFTDSTGLSFAGFNTVSDWTFSTRTVGPDASARTITVAADGTGDFYTVQGAIDWVPSGNTAARTIFIKNGTYFEQVYFSGKHALTFLGESRSGAVITYPNNNNFNNVGGTYHRMVFQADHANNVSLVNLTVLNSTPQNGSQAEAIVLNGGSTTGPAVVSNVDLVSFQDTLLINGPAYIADSHITGDVDFMWGNGPNFFENCQITVVRTGGYLTQIRNGTGHGNVYLNCTIDAPGGINGAYLARIDPTTGNFPNSEVVWLNCVMGSGGTTPIGSAGWLLNNTADQTAASAPNVHFWEYNSHYADGTPLNVAGRIGASKQLTLANDATTIANYSDASWVLGGWTPQLAPVLAKQPAAQTVNSGDGVTLTALGFGVPAVSYQWYRNGTAIAGATNATYTVGAAAAADAGTYTVAVTNSAGTVASATVPVVVRGAPPVIALQPAATSALRGTTATFTVGATSDVAMTYQWSKSGTPIAGATNTSLRLTQVQDADAATYSVAVTNAGGTTVSASAALTLVEPATTLPTPPTIPAARFDVTAYGAVGDGATDNTGAVQAAINAAVAAGGGTVEFPPAWSPYLCGPITLASNVNFQIDGGATLKALPYLTYPRSTSSPSHFITIPSGASNVEFSGTGTIDGNGAAWWAAFNANANQGRPRLVQITKATNLLFTGVTFLNSPNFHLAFSGLNNNVTIYGITISAPGDSPNTDGIDVAGTNFLIQSCNVSDGDDLIVAKPGSVFCRNLYIANCTFGTGHGVSVGGQTNVGLDGMVVTNCTFNGTDTGLRLKADPTQGGPVQNVTFSNITMTNVTYPILFYSYYNQIGSPGARSGSSQTTASKVNTWNSTPPNSLAATTIPTWQNITVSNLTATAPAGYSGYSMIWGLPLANGLISGVTLNNVSLSGGAGFELYDANNVQFTGTNSVGSIVTCNSLAITQQPQSQTVNVGDSVTFTAAAVGASGSNTTAPTFQWMRNGSPLTDGTQADGSVISGSTTTSLAITNVRATNAGNYTFVAANALDGYDVSASSFAPNSLPVTSTSFAAVLSVTALPATVSLSNLSATYDGSAKIPTAATSPSGLPVAFTYNGSSTTPSAAGTYAVVATISDPNYSGSTTGTLVIAPASASVTLGSLAQPYNGSAHPVTATTTPAGLPVAFTYNGSATAPTARGTYTVVGTITDPNYVGSATGSLTVGIGSATVTLSGLAFPYDGTPHAATVTTSPSGLAVAVTYSGAAIAPAISGTYPVVATVTDPNYQGSATGTLVIGKAPAVITLTSLAQTYDGKPKPVTATVLPASLTPTITYNGNATAPSEAGTYAVSASAGDLNFAGTATATLVIAKADQTVTFPSVGTVDLNTPVKLNATASSGQPVSYSVVSGSASVSGATLTITAAGNVVVRATQAGTNNYNPASADITVGVSGKQTQTITFAPIPAHLSTDPAFGLSATASSGLAVSFAVVSGPAVVNGSTLTLTGAAGAVTVRASQTGNATFAPAANVDQTFTVADATTDTFFGDLLPDASGTAVQGAHAVQVAAAKAGDIAAAVVAGTKQGNVLIVAPSLNLNASIPITIGADGTYTATFTSNGQTLTLAGTLTNGVLTGRIAALKVSFSTTVQVRTGSTASYAGYYAASALGTGQGTTYSVVGSNGQALVLTITPTLTTGGVAQVASNGTFTAAPATGVTITGSVSAANATVTSTVVAAGQTTSFSGVKDQIIRTDRLVNLSSRGLVSGGDKVVITGFVIGGTQPKSVLIRAIGPSLASFGVSGVLANPKLQLYQNGKVIAENSGWGTAANASDIAAAFTRLGAFGLTAGSADSAVLLTLQPGLYTAQVSDGPQSGVVLAEIYDGSVNPQGEYQRLVNISTRGDVGIGDNVLIGGFVVTGNSPKKLLIRGVGPGLAAYGVSGTLNDPKLTVFQGTTVLAENDNWGTGSGSVAVDVAAAATQTGAFTLASGSKDAALVLTLAPGGYTAQITGVGGATGVALVEIYEVP